MSEYQDEVQQLISEKPEAKDAISSLIEVDKEKNKWSFDDIPVDSGLFGEIVSRGIVVRGNDGEFFIPNRSAIEEVLNEGQNAPTEETASLWGAAYDERFSSITKYDVAQISLPVVVVVLGFYFRIVGLSQHPLLDGEAIMGMAARSFAENGSPLLPSGYPYNRGELIIYISGASTKVFESTVFAIRLPSAVAGTLSILVIYFLGREIHSWQVGVLVASLQSFSMVSIAWSRTARFYALLQFFLLTGVWSYLRIRESAYIDYNMRRPVILDQYQFGGFSLLMMACVLGAYFTHRGWILIPSIVGLLALLPSDHDVRRITQAKLLLWLTVGLNVAIVVVFHEILVPTAVFDILGLGNFQEISVWEHPYTKKSPVWFFFSYYPVLSALTIGGTVYCLYTGGKNHIPLVALYAPLFFFTYFGSSFRQIWRPRYILLILPFFFLITSILLVIGIRYISTVIGDKVENQELQLVPSISTGTKELSSLALVIILLVGTPVVQDVGVSTDPNQLSLIEEPRPNYQDACVAISDQVYTGDTVITNRPQQLHFWLGKTDYRGNTFTSQWTPDPDRGYYTGATMVNNGSEMRSVIKNNDRVWVVYNQFMDLKAEMWTRENLDLYAVIPSSFDSRFPQGLYSSYLDERENDETVYVFTKGVNKTAPNGTLVPGNC
jgi:4-amino-4-deoxy-L-arabinose transferase-like glycosyltransferase